MRGTCIYKRIEVSAYHLDFFFPFHHPICCLITGNTSELIRACPCTLGWPLQPRSLSVRMFCRLMNVALFCFATVATFVHTSVQGITAKRQHKRHCERTARDHRATDDEERGVISTRSVLCRNFFNKVVVRLNPRRVGWSRLRGVILQSSE